LSAELPDTAEASPATATREAVPARAEHLGPGDFERVYLACEAPLLRYAIRLVRPLEEAQDLVQEAFRRFIGQLRQPQGFQGNARAWLYRIVHNLAIDHYRGASRRQAQLEEIQREMPLAEPATTQPDLQHAQAARLAREKLAELSERERQVIHLKVDQELSYAEIAEIIGTSAGNVGYILHHALKKLRRLLEEAGAV